MDVMFLALALTLHSIAPTTCVVESSFATCSTTTIPLTDLDHVTLYGTRTSITAVRAQKPARALAVEVLVQKPVTAGEPFTMTFDSEGVAWMVWTRYANTEGREGCESPHILVGDGATVDVPPPIARVEYLDISGRIVGKPTAPGIYFVRELRAGKWSHRRVVVLK